MVCFSSSVHVFIILSPDLTSSSIVSLCLKISMVKALKHNKNWSGKKNTVHGAKTIFEVHYDGLKIKSCQYIL